MSSFTRATVLPAGGEKLYGHGWSEFLSLCSASPAFFFHFTPFSEAFELVTDTENHGDLSDVEVRCMKAQIQLYCMYLQGYIH